MIYPSNFEDKIGFTEIRTLLRKKCTNEIGRSYVDDILFDTSLKNIEKLIGQVSEFMEILGLGKSFPSLEVPTIIDELLRIKLPGTFIDPEYLLDLKAALITYDEIRVFFKDPDHTEFILLQEIFRTAEFDHGILKNLEKIISDKGIIKDTASVQLNEIRKKLRATLRTNERLINRILENVKNSGWSGSDSDITIREGRLVIPVNAAHKRKLKGFIHDESATGQTVFMEPQECFDLNNEVRELENKEKREIISILTKFTDKLRPEITSLLSVYRVLGELDLIKAKAKLSTDLNASQPNISDKPLINWSNAVHPLLYLNHKSQNKVTVPQKLVLNDVDRILVISGPNAGGKSVCLKTAGLLQYMLQCGLPIPVDPDSGCGIFKNIFLEIGDEQSILNDLSTYSSHLNNIKHFIQNSDEKTLFLIDEFGAGTDPQMGSAIAEASLETLAKKRALGIVTTHYSNLKLLADTQKGVVNGAMLFDTKRMKPLFQLKIGKPGSSFSFEIAGNINFPADVLDQARGKTGKTHLDFEKQLQELETEKLDVDKKQKEFKAADDLLNDLIIKYEKLTDELKNSRKKIITEAIEEAEQIIKDSNRLIEKTVKNIQEAKADKNKVKTIRNQLSDHKEKLENKKINIQEVKEEEKEEIQIPEPLKENDWVQISGQEGSGQLIKIIGTDGLVEFGDVRVNISISKLKKTDTPPDTELSRKSAKRSISKSLIDKVANFKISVDVRGMSVEEIRGYLQKYIDDAILMNIPEVSILHGKGDGVLRKFIRDYLKDIPEVKHYSDAHVERGGSGITKVFF